MVSAVTHCAGLQSTPLSALPLVPPQPWECWQWTLVSLRHCFPKATSTKPLESGPRTTVVTHLDLLWEPRRQLRPWSSPGAMRTCPQSPQLLRPDPPLPWIREGEGRGGGGSLLPFTKGCTSLSFLAAFSVPSRKSSVTPHRGHPKIKRFLSCFIKPRMRPLIGTAPPSPLGHEFPKNILIFK